MLATLLFFSLNAHHWLLEGLAFSFRSIPPGELSLFKGYNLIIKQFSSMFSFAFMVASPVVIGLLMIDLCTALLTRNMPQLNLYFLVLPIKILLGLFLVFLSLNDLNPLMANVFKRCFQNWREVIA